MVGRPKSELKKQQIKYETKDGLLIHAVALYHHEKQNSEVENRKPLSLRKICKQIEGEHYAATKRTVKLDPCTLRRLAQGGKSKSTSNSEKSWLLPDEVEMVINYAVEVAARGFPLSHKRLKEHVDQICQARQAPNFPEHGVGKNWTNRFITKHSDRLKTYWSHNLEGKRGRAVNPTTNDMWYDLMDDVLKGNRDHEFDNGENEDHADPVEVLPENTYGSDESGFFPEGGVRVRIIGGKGKKTQHQQSDGGRENTTVIVTICADGTALKPAVIFKGQAYQVKWDQENPTDAL